MTALLWLILPLSGCFVAGSPQADEAPAPTIVSIESRAALSDYFASLDYHWHTLDEGVPPIVLEAFPSDLCSENVAERKRIFFLSLLPMVLLVNEEISAQRTDLLRLLAKHDNGNHLSGDDRQRLQQMATSYRLSGDPLTDGGLRQELLLRIDTLPPSMVLAQAASESAYGTSRFARVGNNLFGQWTFTPGAGLVPQNRLPGKSHEVMRFPTLYDSVRSYAMNLNTHWAYADLRRQRAALRSEGKPLKGFDLAEGLSLYSERRDDYVREIRSIIRHNQLALVATTSLRPL